MNRARNIHNQPTEGSARRSCEFYVLFPSRLLRLLGEANVFALITWSLKKAGNSFKHKGRDTRCDKSQRHVAATSRLVCTVTVTSRLPWFCRCDMSHELKPVWIRATNSVAATMIFTCHTRRFVAATCRGDASQRFVASCVSALSDWPLKARITKNSKHSFTFSSLWTQT